MYHPQSNSPIKCTITNHILNAANTMSVINVVKFTSLIHQVQQKVVIFSPEEIWRQRRYAVVCYSSLSIDLDRRCIECVLFVPERSFWPEAPNIGADHCPVSSVQCPAYCEWRGPTAGRLPGNLIMYYQQPLLRLARIVKKWTSIIF